jgi:hypothetical protein
LSQSLPLSLPLSLSLPLLLSLPPGPECSVSAWSVTVAGDRYRHPWSHRIRC